MFLSLSSGNYVGIQEGRITEILTSSLQRVIQASPGHEILDDQEGPDVGIDPVVEDFCDRKLHFLADVHRHRSFGERLLFREHGLVRLGASERGNFGRKSPRSFFPWHSNLLCQRPIDKLIILLTLALVFRADKTLYLYNKSALHPDQTIKSDD